MNQNMWTPYQLGQFAAGFLAGQHDLRTTPTSTASSIRNRAARRRSGGARGLGTAVGKPLATAPKTRTRRRRSRQRQSGVQPT